MFLKILIMKETEFHQLHKKSTNGMKKRNESGSRDRLLEIYSYLRKKKHSISYIYIFL